MGVTADEATADVRLMDVPSLVRVRLGDADGAAGRNTKSVRVKFPLAEPPENPLTTATVLDPSALCVTVPEPVPRVGVLFVRKS